MPYRVKITPHPDSIPIEPDVHQNFLIIMPIVLESYAEARLLLVWFSNDIKRRGDLSFYIKCNKEIMAPKVEIEEVHEKVNCKLPDDWNRILTRY